MLGSAEAEFEAFVTREGRRLLGFAFLLTSNRQDAEDLVQLTLLRAAGRWPAARKHPEGYARTVLVNLARDRWRARRRSAESVAADLDGWPADGHDGMSAVLDRELLLRTCRLLPVQQRAVLVLRFWEDRSVDETAALLGCSTGTVKSHTHRALTRLRAALQDEPVPGNATVPPVATAPPGAGAQQDETARQDETALVGATRPQDGQEMPSQAGREDGPC